LSLSVSFFSFLRFPFNFHVIFPFSFWKRNRNLQELESTKLIQKSWLFKKEPIYFIPGFQPVNIKGKEIIKTPYAQLFRKGTN